jgi:hypothetical protein
MTQDVLRCPFQALRSLAPFFSIATGFATLVLPLGLPLVLPLFFSTRPTSVIDNNTAGGVKGTF